MIQTQKWINVAPVTRVEIIYDDTKSIIGTKPEFKWGQMFHILVEKKVLEEGLEDLALYENILQSGTTKVSTRPEIIPCAEFIGWILAKNRYHRDDDK